jgi:hypothetical protein
MRNFKKESGQILLLIAILLPVLLGVGGLVIDVGNLYIQRSKLRNAADAIALAAAKELPNTNNATGIAYYYANLNNISNSELNITTPYNGDSNKILIEIVRNSPTYFMKIFGFSTVSVYARAVGANANSGFNLIPIAVPDTALPNCIIWGPSNQCNDIPPSGGGTLGSQYKGLVDLGSCDETAEITQDDCVPFTAATNYGNKPKNIEGWVGNGCNCRIGIGNDIPLYNGDLGSNMGTPLKNRCFAQGFSDETGSYGLFTVLVYNRVIGGSKINISGYAVYRVYCNNISSSSASGTFISYVKNDQLDNIVPEGIPTPCLWE